MRDLWSHGASEWSICIPKYIYHKISTLRATKNCTSLTSQYLYCPDFVWLLRKRAHNYTQSLLTRKTRRKFEFLKKNRYQPQDLQVTSLSGTRSLRLAIDITMHSWRNYTPSTGRRSDWTTMRHDWEKWWCCCPCLMWVYTWNWILWWKLLSLVYDVLEARMSSNLIIKVQNTDNASSYNMLSRWSMKETKRPLPNFEH